MKKIVMVAIVQGKQHKYWFILRNKDNLEKASKEVVRLKSVVRNVFYNKNKYYPEKVEFLKFE